MKLRSNIWKLNFLRVLRMFLIVMPIIVLFFQDNGLSLTQIMIIQSVFSLSIVALEIPSGYLSDVWGRKKTLILGMTLSFFGFLTYCFASGFWGILIAELVIGFGSSFISGTDSAMLYDTLFQLKREKEFKKITGMNLAYGNFSESAAALLGGLLATISLRFPFYIETGVVFLGLILVTTLVEPKFKKLKEKDVVRNILKVVRFSLHEHKEIKWLILYSAILGTSTLTAVWFIQPYFIFINLPLVAFGVVWAALNLSVGLFSMYAYKYENFFGKKVSLISMIFLIFIAYFSLSFINSYFGIAVVFIFYLVRGVNNPLILDYIHSKIESNVRATVISVKNMIGRVIFAVFAPIIGYFADAYTLQTAFRISSVVLLFFGVICLIFLSLNKGFE